MKAICKETIVSATFGERLFTKDCLYEYEVVNGRYFVTGDTIGETLFHEDEFVNKFKTYEDAFKDVQDKCDRANAALQSAGVTWHEAFIQDVVEGVVGVDVEWGDWKHDHARVDWILAEAGFTKVSETLYEEDGSDCYSAAHFYKWR